MSDTQEQWTEERMIAHAEGVAAHWRKKVVGDIDVYELSRDILRLLRQQKDHYEAHLAAAERERDAYKNQAGLLEDNGRLVSWRMVNAEARVDELEQELTEAQVMLEPCLVCGRMREMESEDADNGE